MYNNTQIEMLEAMKGTGGDCATMAFYQVNTPTKKAVAIMSSIYTHMNILGWDINDV